MSNRLSWEYCECGCHGHTLSAAGLHFWQCIDVRQPERDQRHVLCRGHGSLGVLLMECAGPYKTASKKFDDLVRKELQEAAKEIVKVLEGPKTLLIQKYWLRSPISEGLWHLFKETGLDPIRRVHVYASVCGKLAIHEHAPVEGYCDPANVRLKPPEGQQCLECAELEASDA